MNSNDIIRHRLINQQLVKSGCKTPQEVVSALVAMQAQDFAMAKWGIGLRLPGWSDADIEKSFNEGTIHRTHLMRPTWHFVTPKDIRWLLNLTAPRVNSANAFMYKKLELDTAIFKRCNEVLIKTLQGGKNLNRSVLNEALAGRRIIASGLRLGYLLMRAELDGIICSGPRVGKQFTYTLLEERVPPAQPLKRQEALARFITRYFESRGPATVQDFVYWSGLTMKEAKQGIATLPSFMKREIMGGREYFFVPIRESERPELKATFLLPDYDEYGMSYKDRSVYLDTTHLRDQKVNSVYAHTLIVHGRFAGTWEQVKKGEKIIVTTNPHIRLSKMKQRTISIAVSRYVSFVTGSEK